MPSGTAGRRYAQAIFALAKEQNKLEQWSKDLTDLRTVFGQADVQTFLENPKTTRESKIQFVKNTLGSQVSPEALNLTQLLVQRNRQGYIEQISEEFTRQWNRLRGIVVAQVTTAVPVDEAETTRIQSELAKMVNKQVTVEMKVDPTIIGGVIAQIEDTLIDGSVRTRLQNLRKQLA